MKSLIEIVKHKDKYLAQHLINVMNYSKMITEQEYPYMLNTVIWAAKMHDIGKICISNKILQKPDSLNKCEWSFIKIHPLLGTGLFVKHYGLNLHNIEDILDGIRHHHERWDGNGYPDGLAKKDIPMAARIIAVADSFDAMTASRPYKRTLNKNQALEEISRCAGTQFDPEVAGIFISLMDDQKNIVRTSS